MAITQLPAKNWVRGISNFVAGFHSTPEKLHVDHGLTFTSARNNDWGTFDEALFLTPSGHLFGLVCFREALLPETITLLVDSNLEDSTSIVNEVMCILGWTTKEAITFDLKYYRFLPCTLFRQDEHGNQVSISSYDIFPDAFKKMSELEKNAHKQFYFIKMEKPPPKGWTGEWHDTRRSLSEAAYTAKGIDFTKIPPWNNPK